MLECNEHEQDWRSNDPKGVVSSRHLAIGRSCWGAALPGLNSAYCIERIERIADQRPTLGGRHEDRIDVAQYSINCLARSTAQVGKIV